MKRFTLFSFLFVILLAGCSDSSDQNVYKTYLPENTKRHWIGVDFWANRLQDWQVNNARIECLNASEPRRTVHLISQTLKPKGKFEAMVEAGICHQNSKLSEQDWCGFLIGAGTYHQDYRKRALIHQQPLENGGIIAAINGEGKIVFIDNEDKTKKYTIKKGSQVAPVKFTEDGFILKLKIKENKDETCDLELAIYDISDETLLLDGSITNIPEKKFAGNIALIANGGDDAQAESFWFKNFKAKGERLEAHPEQKYGPILAVQYTLHENILKLTAQFPPLDTTREHTVFLEVAEDTSYWENIAKTSVENLGYLARFRIPDWSSSKDMNYRLVYRIRKSDGKLKDYIYSGTIKKDPVDKEEIVVAGFTGNSNGSLKNLWFPHQDIVTHVKAHNPDVMVFTGDQVYEGRPTPPDFSSKTNTELDYLYKWYLWCWAYHTLSADRPTICLPDDHDVYHGNIWGAGGIKARKKPENDIYPYYYKGFEGHWQQDQGGYKLHPETVNMVQRTQTSHFPDPYDPTPVAQGIEVYYTEMNYGQIGFAIIEDRKFKSAPSMMLPNALVVNGFSQKKDIEADMLQNPDAKLLGKRQLKFLEEWIHQWENTDMKVILSQTIFANLSTYPDTFLTDAGTPKLKPLPQGVIPKDYSLAKDMDSNGWPHTARNNALRVIRKGFAFMLAGDQHLASVIQHGVEDWNNAGYSFCVPSVANLWPRRWFPPEPGLNHEEGMPPYTGQYLDGFGNHITVKAVANPYLSGEKPALLHDRAPGYGIVRLNKTEKTITMECWPRHVNPQSTDAKQYPGWPVTISLYDNFNAQAEAYLPKLRISGLEKPPVIHVIQENNEEIIYSVRLNDFEHKPKVFDKHQTYTVKIGEPGTKHLQTFENIKPLTNTTANDSIMEVKF